MTEKENPLADLIASGEAKVITYGDLRVEQYAGGVLNINTIDAEEMFTNEYLLAFRDDLRAIGYEERESWIARQGVSWLSDGVFAGISLRIRKVKP